MASFAYVAPIPFSKSPHHNHEVGRCYKHQGPHFSKKQNTQLRQNKFAKIYTANHWQNQKPNPGQSRHFSLSTPSSGFPSSPFQNSKHNTSFMSDPVLQGMPAMWNSSLFPLLCLTSGDWEGTTNSALWFPSFHENKPSLYLVNHVYMQEPLSVLF